MSDDKNKNIIKEVRAKYNLSYEELEDITGIPKGTLQNQGSSGDIKPKVRKPIELYIKTREQEEVIENTDYLRTALNIFMNKKPI